MDPETNSKNSQNLKQPANGLAAFGLFVWDLVKILILAVIIIVPFRIYIAEPFMVSGHSMLPNYRDKDYLIIDRLSYRWHEPQRGDVVVLKFPKDTSQYYIKRIIGLPGEQVRCGQGKVEIIDAEKKQKILEEPYLPPKTQTNNCKPLQVLGSGEYFVLGDNRTASSDSRAWGILPKDDIIGRAWLRAFPLGDFGVFHSPIYAQ